MIYPRPAGASAAKKRQRGPTITDLLRAQEEALQMAASADGDQPEGGEGRGGQGWSVAEYGRQGKRSVHHKSALGHAAAAGLAAGGLGLGLGLGVS